MTRRTNKEDISQAHIEDISSVLESFFLPHLEDRRIVYGILA